MRKSKNCYFYHIFVYPGAITLNVVWMERKFDAYKLSCCMCLSNYNRFWHRARYEKMVILSYSLAFDAPGVLVGISAPPLVRKNRYFYHILFLWGRPCGNHAKCCMDGKRIWCLQIVSQHVPIYLQQFPSYSSAKNRRFHVPQPTFSFPLETPLRLSRNTLHGWKDNSMLAKPLATCTYLSSILSELYDA